MKAMVLYAHPCEESFGGALHRQIVTSLTDRGWEVDDCDLYAENFQPVLTTEERRAYHEEPQNCGPVQPYVDRLRTAEALVFSFPVWNFGYPAILKGFLDRVFLPGVAFSLVNGKVGPNLKNINKLAAVTTYGGTRLRSFVAGDPPRKHFTRSMRYITQANKTRYMALYDMNRTDDTKRAAFLNKVDQEMRVL